MTAVQRIINWYKGLPPHLQVILAMAGLSGPGLLLGLPNLLGVKSTYVYVALFLVLGGSAGIASLVRLGIRRKKRGDEEKVERTIAKQAESAPRQLEEATDIRQKNRDFVEMTREYRRHYRQSVYEAPWYMVIGDSGCGKTRLVNALFSSPDLDLMKGRPEGWQLGGYQYNWWPSADAIFLDMAGRLIMGAEENGYDEWLKALTAFKKARPGCPINGVILCISAKHLLTPTRTDDGPIEQQLWGEQADILLKRLRDLQKHLDVTFATYLVVTQCDRIPGFIELFYRTDQERSRHQMFGWSRPGDYDQPYDPAHFARDFDELRARLHDVVIRRLNDDAPAPELGMAYLFPDQFRQLLPGLQEYVRVLFPKAAVAAKARRSLLFRGVYFTSSMQTGSLITKLLEDQMGREVVAPFKELDLLVPRPSPIFVKDLFTEKVFPEQGLVFPDLDRARKHVRLGRTVQIGSVAALALLMGALSWGISEFDRLVGNASALVDRIKGTRAGGLTEDLSDLPRLDGEKRQAFIRDSARVLTEAENGLTNSKLLHLISVTVGNAQDALGDLRAGLFEEGVLRPLIGQTEARLGNGYLLPLATDERRKSFIASLAQYCSLATSNWADAKEPKNVEARLTELTSIAPPPAAFLDHLPHYAEVVCKHAEPRDSRKALWPKHLQNESAVIPRAVDQYVNAMAPWAEFADSNPDKVVAQWARVNADLQAATLAYNDELLPLAQCTDTKTPKGISKFRDAFQRAVKTFSDHLECDWPDGTEAGNLGAALDRCRERWKADHGTVTAHAENNESIRNALANMLVKLDTHLCDSLTGKVRKPTATRPVSTQPDWKPSQVTIEVFNAYDHVIEFKSAPPVSTNTGVVASASSRPLSLTKDAEAVRKALDDVLKRLSPPGSGGAAESRELWFWAQRIAKDWEAMGSKESGASVGFSLTDKAAKAWNKSELDRLLRCATVQVTEQQLLNDLQDASTTFQTAETQPWGIATLVTAPALPANDPLGILACGRRPFLGDEGAKAFKHSLATLHKLLADDGKRFADVRSDLKSASQDAATNLSLAETKYFDEYFSAWRKALRPIEGSYLKSLIEEHDFDKLRKSLPKGEQLKESRNTLKVWLGAILANVTFAEDALAGSDSKTAEPQLRDVIGRLQAARTLAFPPGAVPEAGELREGAPSSESHQVGTDEWCRARADAVANELEEFIDALSQVTPPSQADLSQGKWLGALGAGKVAWKGKATDSLQKFKLVARLDRLRYNAKLSLDGYIHNMLRQMEADIGDDHIKRIELAIGAREALQAWDEERAPGAELRKRWYASAESWRQFLQVTNGVGTLQLTMKPLAGERAWINRYSEITIKMGTKEVSLATQPKREISLSLPSENSVEITLKGGDKIGGIPEACKCRPLVVQLSDPLMRYFTRNPEKARFNVVKRIDLIQCHREHGGPDANAYRAVADCLQRVQAGRDLDVGFEVDLGGTSVPAAFRTLESLGGPRYEYLSAE